MLLENETTISPPATHTMQTQNWRRFLLMIVKYAYYEKSLDIIINVYWKTFRKYNINLSQHRHFELCLL